MTRERAACRRQPPSAPLADRPTAPRASRRPFLPPPPSARTTPPHIPSSGLSGRMVFSRAASPTAGALSGRAGACMPASL